MLTKENYLGIVRALAVIGGFILLGVSVNFSVTGFNIVVPHMAWVGILLSIVVTILELVFTKSRTNLTLFVAGLIAYVYAIYTNVVGILTAQGNFPPDTFGPVAGPIIIGILLDIVPEPLIVFGLVGEAFEDMLTHILDSFSGNKGGNRGGPPARMQQFDQQPRRQHNSDTKFDL